MKRRLFTFALAALTIGLLGSCSKINERIDGLDKRVYDLENTKIASIEQQIAAINQSIADLETIRTNIQNLKNEQEAQGQDITALKAADITLEGKINDLKDYVDTELAKYATKDWANATFATLEVQANIIIDVEKLKAGLANLDTKLDQDIANLKTYIEGWVNTQLSAYYKKAEIDVTVGELQAQITTLKEDSETNKTKIAELELNLNKLNQDLEEAKTTIKAAYEKAIKDAIEDYNGTITETIQSKIDEVNSTINDLTARVEILEFSVLQLTGRVEDLEAMIQSVSITPAYSDGSVEAVNGILTLKCTVSPAEALIGMESLKDSLLIYADSVKVKTKATTPAYMTIEVSEASVLDAAQGAITLKADISEYLPKGEDRALTVAVNIKNGISHYTTEFVPVYVAPAPAATTGTAKATIGGRDVDVKWVQLWANGPKFAEYNVGVTDGKAEGYGGYYTWGGSTNQDSNKVYKNGESALTGTDDTATNLWGSNWRMPTQAELQGLLSNCDVEWMDGSTKKYNNTTVKGRLYTGKGAYASNSVFLPAAGYYRYPNGVSGQGSFGNYWSSTPGDSESAYDLYIIPSNQSMSNDKRYFGFSVRAVLAE